MLFRSGLAVAIPTMIAFSVLQSKANRLTEDVEAAAMITMDLLSARMYREEWDDLGNPKDRPTIPVMHAETKQIKSA